MRLHGMRPEGQLVLSPEKAADLAWHLIGAAMRIRQEQLKRDAEAWGDDCDDRE
jgi:hypothetical protein